MRSIRASANFRGDVGERAAHDALLRRTRLHHDRRRTIGAVERRELLDDGVDRMNGEMDDERRAGRGEGGELLASGMREARPDTRVSTTLCATSGTVSSHCNAAAAAAKAGTPGVSV